MAGDVEVEFEKSLKTWSRALTKYLKLSKKDTAFVINNKLGFVVRRALKNTFKASKPHIEHELGVVAYKVSISKKTGKFAARRKIFKGTRAENIIQGSRINAGKKPLPKSEAKKAARKLLRSRLRAIGSLKSGWIKIIKTLSKATRIPTGSIKGPRVKHKGHAKPANARKKIIESVAEYAVHVKRDGKLIIDPRVVLAAARAFRVEARDTGKHIAKKWRKNWEKDRL